MATGGPHVRRPTVKGGSCSERVAGGPGGPRGQLGSDVPGLLGGDMCYLDM